jgi:hypothetical protein
VLDFGKFGIKSASYSTQRTCHGARPCDPKYAGPKPKTQGCRGRDEMQNALTPAERGWNNVEASFAKRSRLTR